ncbi:ArsR/SmtB family transcription factor [Symbioplanes lichenis]|uniref:ArsR/SmtB family transcription factor n=1 Tax=Symbioplanes lichenis TaxID=1629072 RepID=UPI00273860E3|nr:helix-turn-helix domain-containing protein [Actinoplanes lichenis]
MLRFEFTAADLAGVRFAHSPMAEVVASAVALRRSSHLAVYATWRTEVGVRLGGRRLSTFDAVVREPRWHVPDFLTPVPTVVRPRLRDELAVVAATPLDRVAAEVAEAWDGTPAPPATARFARDPRGALTMLISEIREYFAVALAPYWPRLRAVAEADIARRGRAVAEQGSRALITDLHPAVSWDSEALAVGYGPEHTGSLTAGDLPLTLMPSAFTGPKVLSLARPDTGRALFYPPHGFGAVWTGSPVPPRLGALLGPTRAAVLSLVGAPHSTGEVADVLSLAPATASHHLTILRDAGLVTAYRTGRRLLYQRTPLGDELSGPAGT